MVLCNLIVHRFNAVFLVDLSGYCDFSSQITHLIVDILAIVSWHPHALVKIFECAVRHLECFLADCRYTSQVGLVTLVFQNGFFSELDSVLLLQFLYHRFNELILEFSCLNHSLNLNLNLFLGLTFNNSFSSNLREHFEASKNPH